MMKNILAQVNREVLEQFARSKMLLAFDYDGTLAPIVEEPGRAFMLSTTRELLARAAELYPTIIISGRAQDDVLKRLRGVNVYAIVGNHGLEPWHGSHEIIATVEQWRVDLTARLEPFKGVWVEDKIYSLAVHYRQSREKKKARAAVLEAATALGSVRLIGGKQVVNILPHGAPHKGIALERERERLACDTAIYIGDDETDEDVFALDQPGRLLTIRVGAKRTSAASYYISQQPAIDELLQALVELRGGPEQRHRVVP
jgi:trehalose 6-phosphate phosphatase